jgi:hypothetical protein
MVLSMKIELEEPYKSLYKSGYIVINKENRRMVLLSRADKSQTTTSYARYLYSVKLGHLVPDDLHVDHINDDCTDDRIENFQLLTPEQNRLKQEQKYREYIQIKHNMICNNCNKPFVLTDRQLKMKQKAGIKNFYCDKECFTEYSKKNFKGNNGARTPNATNTKSLEIVNKIKELRSYGWSSPRISKELNIARNTVMKYWNINNEFTTNTTKKGLDIVIIDNKTNTVNIYNSLTSCSNITGLSTSSLAKYLKNKVKFKYKGLDIMKLSTYLETHKKIKGNLPCVK